MSVIVIVEFPGTSVDTFTAVHDRSAETMRGIAAEARSKGAIHHAFVESANGTVMVVDEWSSREEFEAFFDAQEDIRKIVAEMGLSGAPTTTSYRVLETSDSF